MISFKYRIITGSNKFSYHIIVEILVILNEYMLFNKRFLKQIQRFFLCKRYEVIIMQGFFFSSKTLEF